MLAINEERHEKEADKVPKENKKIVYVVGAGLSAGLGFPTIRNLLPLMWERLEKAEQGERLEKIIRFHHPEFNTSLHETYPDIEQLLSEIQANEQLFSSSRQATGLFSPEDLLAYRRDLLLEIAEWFHELKKKSLRRPPPWLSKLSSAMISEQASIISFNWDLVLDELLFGANVSKENYAFGHEKEKGRCVRLIKPHGSLNWYEERDGRHIKKEKKIKLIGSKESSVYAFKPLRAPRSSSRKYMPLIVPPVYAKTFEADIFRLLWQETVSALSTADEVRFLGYSLAHADFHARFILRCGFHNQEFGEILAGGNRSRPTGRSKVTIVDKDGAAHERISSSVGWSCNSYQMSISDWVETEMQ